MHEFAFPGPMGKLWLSALRPRKMEKVELVKVIGG
jgi:hypothetical protein